MRGTPPHKPPHGVSPAHSEAARGDIAMCGITMDPPNRVRVTSALGILIVDSRLGGRRRHWLGLRFWRRLEGGEVSSVITTLDKKAYEILVWLYAMHSCQNHSPSS